MPKLNFNRAPYFDDFSASKTQMKVLFKPSRPVQARELNVAQSIISNQISSFADHVFKNGSKVSNARSSMTKYEYVRVRETIDVEFLKEGMIVTGVASGLKGKFVIGSNNDGVDPATLYIVYINTAVDGETTSFVPGEGLEIQDENGQIIMTGTVRCPSCPGSSESGEVFPTGKGHVFTVDEGVFYFEGMFLQSRRQSIIVSKYSHPKGQADSSFDGRKIGFDFVQTITTSDEDPSLFDPSLGYPNATAPGADRYTVDLSLTTRSYDEEDGDKFLLICKMRSGYVVDYQKTDSEYADLMDNIAKRTYETNGDYTVRPFKLSFYEHKKKTANDPLGWDVNGSEANIIALITPSVGYIRGYRVETIADTPILMKKARDSKSLNTFVKRFDEGSYITLMPSSNIVWPNEKNDVGVIGNETISFYDDLLGTGNIVGHATVVDLERVSGLNFDHTAIYKYRVIDVVMSSGKTFNDIKSAANVPSAFIADAVVSLGTGNFELSNPDNSPLVFEINKPNIQSLRDSDNSLNGSMTITVRKKLKATLDSSGSYTFATTTDEFFSPLNPRTIVYATSGSNVTETFDLTGSNISITETSMTLSLGAAYSGHTVTVITDVIRTNQKEKNKTLIPFVYTTSGAPQILAGSREYLGKADAFSVTSIEVYNHQDPGNPVLVKDVTSEYFLNNGANDWYYGESSVVLKNALSVAVTGDMRLHVSFKYFEHSGNVGFFTIDSYSDVINDPANDLTYEDIPSFVSSKGTVIPLISAIDFRPIKIGTDVTGTIPSSSSTALFDCAFYLPRADIIQINKNGLIYSKQGVPGENPALPKPDADAMVLYHVFLSAYTYTIDDVKMKYIENKRYTMRDIGRLEKRISDVEYYTTLSLLERSAADMSIKDENGLDRFKNGFLADDFTEFQAADLENFEFRASMDRKHSELRPRFKASGVKLAVNKALSTNVVWHGEYGTLPYVSETQSENPYGTKHISINPYFMYGKKGSLVLSPNNDTWSEENLLPEIVTNVDAGSDALKKILSPGDLLGTRWGSWSSQNSTIVGAAGSPDSSKSSVPSTGFSISPSSPAASSSTQIVSTISVATSQSAIERVDTYTVESDVKDVQIIPFARGRVIQFYASNLRPNTRVYAYFDKTPVFDSVRSISNPLTTSNSASVLSQIAFGSPLYTDQNGAVIGEFSLPTGRYFTGKSEFKLSDDPTGLFEEDVETTYATATYFSGGLELTRQTQTLNISTPVVQQVPSAPVQQVSAAPYTADQHYADWLVAGGVGSRNDFAGAIVRDPVAQQFFVDEDQFITGLDIFLERVDQTSDLIWVEIRTMVNGYPSNSPLTRREFKPEQLTFSPDSSAVQHIEFYNPVFVEGGENYCFVVGGASPNTRIWVAKLGQEVVNMPGKIVETQPTVGSSFRSQNGVTWNAEQFETIKYKLYRAKFTQREMSVVFQNKYEEEGVFTLEENPLETQAGKDLVRVYWKSHGFTENDRVALSLYDGIPLKLNVIGLPPQINQFIHTATGSGWISRVEKTGVASEEYSITLKRTQGRFLQNQGYTADATTVSIRDTSLLANAGIIPPVMNTVNAAYGLVAENSSLGAYLGGEVNGIPVEEISKELTVKTVDSIDSFVVQVTTPSNYSGRVGGDSILCYDFNIRYETFNASGSYLAYNSVEGWEFTGCGHGTENGIFSSENYLERGVLDIAIGADYSLDKPNKVSGSINETRAFGSSGQKSIKLTGNFSARTPYVSPVIDAGSFSVATVSNMVDFNEESTYNVFPNPVDRLVPETTALLGSGSFKYVTRTINLNDPASDLVIWVDYSKDVNADFDIYVKKIFSYETTPVEQLPWVKLDITTKKSANTVNEFIEGQYKCSELVAGWKDGNDEDIPYSSFKIKIVGRSKNTAKPPRFKKLRAVAVT